jgi:hypothetical protein
MILWVKGSEQVAFSILCRREDYPSGVGASASKWRSAVRGVSGSKYCGFSTTSSCLIRPFVDRCGRLSGRFCGFRTAFCCSMRHSSPP